MMRFLSIIGVIMGLCLPGGATGYSYVTDAWSWGHDNPLSLTPQQIALNGAPTSKYGDVAKNKIKVEDDDYATKTTVYSYNKHYVYFSWNYKPAGVQIWFNWRVAVAGGAKVKLYYWDGNSWEYITENPGGWPPYGMSTEVKQYYNGNYLHLLAVGNTKPGNKWAKCDVGRLE
jgi:hypothetical protein